MKAKNSTDEQLIAKLQKSEKDRGEALDELYRDDSFRRKAFAVISRTIPMQVKNDHSLPNEIFDEMFIVLCKKVEGKEFRLKKITALRTFLINICINKCKEYYPRRRGGKWLKRAFGPGAMHRAEKVAEPKKADTDLIEQESGEVALIRKIIDKIGGKCKTFLINHYIFGKTIKETAIDMGLASTTTRDHYSPKCKTIFEELARKDPEFVEFLSEEKRNLKQRNPRIKKK